MTNDGPLLLTAKQAWRRLGVGKTRFYELKAHGLLTGIEVGGPQTIRYHIRDVEQAAERLRERAGAA
jgi:hypothetical protein